MSESSRPREARTEVDWIAVLRLADGTEIPCSVKDVSSTGMKVSVSAGQALPDTFSLKIVGRNLVFRVKQAWRRQHQVGVLIEKIAKLPNPPAAASAPEMRRVDVSEHQRLGSRERFHPGA